jgi:SAM-dependent methyltransferase
MTAKVEEALYSGKPAEYFGIARTEIAPLIPESVTRVLEIGCGSGATIKWLRSVRRIEYAAGVELSSDAAARAASVFDDIIENNIEAADLPFAPESFDLILALDVLEHLVDPWRIVRQLHSLLRPGGTIIASLPNIAHYSVSLSLLLRSRWDYANEGLLDRTHLRFFVERTAVDLMTSSGLVVEKRDRVVHLPRAIYAWPRRYGGHYVRWNFIKLMRRLRLSHLIDYQFLLSVRSTGRCP